MSFKTVSVLKNTFIISCHGKKYGTSTYLQSIIWREDTDQFLQDQNF